MACALTETSIQPLKIPKANDAAIRSGKLGVNATANKETLYRTEPHNRTLALPHFASARPVKGIPIKEAIIMLSIAQPRVSSLRANVDLKVGNKAAQVPTPAPCKRNMAEPARRALRMS